LDDLLDDLASLAVFDLEVERERRALRGGGEAELWLLLASDDLDASESDALSELDPLSSDRPPRRWRLLFSLVKKN
jgi:hypothetical protein